jgi:hypothetical protein
MPAIAEKLTSFASLDISFILLANYSLILNNHKETYYGRSYTKRKTIFQTNT